MKDNHVDKSQIKVCVICAETIKPKFLGLDNDGNNADGVCCDHCNKTVVIPERMTNILMSRNLDSFNKLI